MERSRTRGRRRTVLDEVVLDQSGENAGRGEAAGDKEGRRDGELLLVDGRELVDVLQDALESSLLERLLEVLVPAQTTLISCLLFPPLE